MLEKIKQMRELHELQKYIKSQETQVEKSGIKVRMNGAFEILEVVLNPELTVPSQEKILRDLLNEAREKLQKEIARSMAGKFQ